MWDLPPGSSYRTATFHVNSKANANSSAPGETPDRDTGARPDASSAVDFERSLAELEAIVAKLEQGDLSLDDSLRHFERGVQLTRACQNSLKLAEQKVHVLMSRSGDPESFDAVPFDADDDDRER